MNLGKWILSGHKRIKNSMENGKAVARILDRCVLANLCD